MITLEDFKKLDIRIGKVVSAERIPDSNKLIKFVFDIGGEQRQVLAGIAEAFPDSAVLLGKEMPLLLNLEPRKFRGFVGEGMMLAADADGQPILLHPAQEVSPGSSVR